MCRYEVISHACSHRQKLLLQLCNSEDCIEANFSLKILKEKLALTQKCIHEHNTSNASKATNTDYDNRMDELCKQKKEFFGYGSGNTGKPLKSLEQLEECYEYEISAVCLSVEKTWESNWVCQDGCWEGVRVEEREAEEKIDREEWTRRWKEWERGQMEYQRGVKEDQERGDLEAIE